MKGFKKAEWCLLALRAKHPWHGLDGRGLPDTPCPLAVDYPWCTLGNTGPQLSSPWWGSGAPSLAGCAARGWLAWSTKLSLRHGQLRSVLVGLAWWRSCPGLWVCCCVGLPAVIQFQFLKHGPLLSSVAASQHCVSLQGGSVLVSVEVLLSWMETKHCFLDKIPAMPWPVSFRTKKKDKGVTFFPPKRIAFTISLIPNCAAISQGVLTSFPIFQLIRPCPYFACVCIYSSVTLNQICLCFCDLCIFFLEQENIHYQMLWEQYSNWRLFYMKILLIVPPLEISLGSSLPAKWISKSCSWKLLIYNTITQHCTCSLSIKSFCDQWFTSPFDYSRWAQTVS